MKLIREINVFILVGLCATACNYVAALAAARFLGLPSLAAGFAGYAASVSISYFGNSVLTFRLPPIHGPQFAKFAAISLAGLAINLGLVWAGTDRLGWPLWQAEIPVVLIVPAAAFVMSKFWAFRTPAAQPAA